MKIKYNNELISLRHTYKDGKYIICLNGKDYTFNKNNFNEIINIDTKQIVYKVEDNKFIYVYINGEYYKFEKVDSDYSNDNIANNNSDYESIFSPTPGNIIKVLVVEGQTVKEGSPLIIIESMKMENTIYSSISGVVSNIKAKAGEQVSNELQLLEIKNIEV